MPSAQRVNTALPQMFSITPASAAQSASSVAPSPYMNSVQSSPLINQGHNYGSHLANPNHFELPESVIQPSLPNGTKETQPGLIRKISQSAKGQISHTRQALRRKTSASHQGRRDESTGPIARRRSDSKTVQATGSGTEYAAFEPSSR